MDPPGPQFPIADSHPSLSGAVRDGDLHRLRRLQNHSLAADLEALRSSRQSLRSESSTALPGKQDITLTAAAVDEAAERDDNWRTEAEAGDLRIELEALRRRIEGLETEKRARDAVLARSLETIRALKEGLERVIDSLGDEKLDVRVEEGGEARADLSFDEETKPIWEELTAASRLAAVAETKVGEYEETRKKEKRALENSVVSLTEENRDINTLLRVSLVEKEAVEKSLNRLKGNSDQKRAPLLQRVGFGLFMMGAQTMNEPSSESSAASVASSKSDGSECEEEGVSLASTVEKIMKNLRLEITQLRNSLEESRSDTERLQSLTGKQAHEIAENILYIKDMEERETLLTQSVEELLMEMKETEEEVGRWREACELEVEAGKHAVEERDKVVAILQQELDKTKAALRISNSKLKLKEDVAAAAMAAQAAAERSLQLADGRATALRERIEELTRLLEEAENRERKKRHRVRYLCWPLRVFKWDPAATTRFPNLRRMLPEMQALLPQSV